MLPPPSTPSPLTPLPTPHYLIHLPPDPRPHHTTLPFLASAFTSWSHRVDTLTPSSLYIAQHLKREYHEILCGRQRPSALLLWALEVVRRGEEGRREGRDSVEGVMGDFVLGLISCDTPPTKSVYRASTAYPSSFPPVLTLYTSLLSHFRTTLNASHPRLGFYTGNERLEAVAFDIGPHWARRKEQIWGAVRYAAGRRAGRTGEVGKRRGEGVRGEWEVGVRFWVVVGGREGRDGEGEEEGLPGYERVEGEGDEEEGERPPAYDEVVVREEEGC